MSRFDVAHSSLLYRMKFGQSRDGCQILQGIDQLRPRLGVQVQKPNLPTQNQFLLASQQQQGTNKIEAIVLNDLPRGDDIIQLSPDAFMGMKRLRLFIIKVAYEDYDGCEDYDEDVDYTYCSCDDVDNGTLRLIDDDDVIQLSPDACVSGELNSLPNELKVIDWDGYHLPPSLPSNFQGNKLSYLRMTFSRIQDARMDFPRLTVMNFSRSKLLTKIPNLSRNSNLKELILSRCTNLEEIHESVGLLDKLVRFDLRGCSKLRSFPGSIKLRSLEFFNLRCCSSLQHFPEIEGEMKNLRKIYLNGSGIKELPSSIINISGLCSLECTLCKNLMHLPGIIFQLQHLESVQITACPQFRGFGEKLMEDNRQFMASIMPNREYEISWSPPRNSSVSRLRSLEFNICKNLTHLPEHLPGIIFQLQHLESVRIEQCPQFRGFGEKLMEDNRQFMASIVPNGEYEISGSPPRNSSISGLLSLEFYCCENLTHLPGIIFQLQHLESVRIEQCPQFRGFGEKLMEDNRQFMASIVPNGEYEISGSPPRNSSISNDDCYKEAAVQASEFLRPENFVLPEFSCFRNSTWQPSLSELGIIGCDIVSLPASIKRFVRLRRLSLVNCKQLQEIPELPQSIVKVIATGCISLESFPQVSKKFQFDTSDDSLDKLIWLDLCGCHKMLEKLRNPVLSPWLRTDYVLDGIAYYRRGPPTWFSHREENRCRISVIFQECLEEAITIALCAVIVQAWGGISASASIVREGRSPRLVDGTTIAIGNESTWPPPHLFLAYTTVEPSELERNHLEVEFSASYYGDIASCEVHRVHEHKKRVETLKRKRDDVLQMDVSNAEPENLLDLLSMIDLYESSRELRQKQDRCWRPKILQILLSLIQKQTQDTVVKHWSQIL
ncbi:TMV resistance protein N [Morella rubra]|uniref:TMV resistance protein N n=1 Tax=Morella rubra TaxID=262757 RepID=A0A6A1V030_9ROSI|nr:TMV resistance protein N [Morella rubra]